MQQSRWCNIPFSPGRFPFFYGWVICATITIGTIMSIPGQTIGVGVFTDFLMDSLTLTRVEISRAYMIGTLISSLLLPFAGNALDRWGSRVTVVLASLGLALSTILLASSPGICAAFDSPPTLLIFAVATACFLAIRFFGQGCLTMISRVTLSKWFNHRRGLATAISGVIISFAFNGSPFFLNHLIARFGWQHACWIMAGIVGIGMSTIGWLFYRDNPEQCGLVMDGTNWDTRDRDPDTSGDTAEQANDAPNDPTKQTDHGNPNHHQNSSNPDHHQNNNRDNTALRPTHNTTLPETEKQFTRGQALRTLAFWVFTFGIGWHALLITAVSFHIVSIAGEFGIGRKEAYVVFLPMSVFATIATFTSGWASDRIRLKWLLILMLLCQSLGSLGIILFHSPAGKALMAIGYGLASGIFGVLLTVPWPRFFGREHLGAISGVYTSLLVLGSAIGPVMFAETQELFGSYRHIELISIAVAWAGIVPALFAHNPQLETTTS